jgi:hypothetical protein
MPSLDASPLPTERRNPAVERHNARLGLVLFAIYLAGYAAFVAASAFAPRSFDAVLAGMALIGGAFGLALVYMALCRNPKPGDSA